MKLPAPKLSDFYPGNDWPDVVRERDEEIVRLKAQIASAEANARLEEAGLWSAPPDCEEDRHGHYTPYDTWARERIAALEKLSAARPRPSP
jgi:hypothetical protein